MEKQLKKILFITNIPAPYRIDFYNELGKYYDLTVLFEAKRAPGITFNWKEDAIRNFKTIFLKEGNIEEKRIDWSIFKYIKSLKYDRIVITNYAYATEMMALLSIKSRKIPYYYELDGAMANYQEAKIKRFIKRFFLSGAKGYISPSKISDEYIKFYAGSKARIYRYPFTSLKESDILQNPVTYQEKADIKKQLKIAENKIVLAIGQFIPRKGFDILLKASQHINKEVGIYIVGGKPTPEYLKMQQDMNLTNVHFEGFKTKQELSLYFKAADIFVHPTREDIWGLVINEAMGYGLPTITTNKCVAGMELLPAECIIDTENVEQLSNSINKMLADESLCKELSKENLEKIKEYTIEKMVIAHQQFL